ncbi:acetylornithine deacetylase [Wolfiporia cocos MD-104 SS10]|uniref:Acetylornithine deacetylase n=1 Tax=Wolfiporia cocos (strain MD-104) TaxID=742152 RepID=A0A2H3K479_WOLCO|nr:acetylornithine deacetylase [Wolfiporia cocos MD-104 SS10]
MSVIYHSPETSSYVAPSSARPDARIIAFHRGLEGYAPTPLVSLPHLARDAGVASVLIKDESTRFGLPAFKILGASWAACRAIADHLGLNMVESLDDLAQALKGRDVTLFAATDGNHGRAVARMAALLSVRCEIYVPRGLDSTTKALIASEGAEVVELQGDYDYAVCEANRAAKEARSGILIQDTAFEGYERIPQWIVDGYTTMLTELDEQILQQTEGRHADVVIVPVGVGSLAQAVVAHYKQKDCSKKIKVITVEPDTAACLKRSLLVTATGHDALPATLTSNTIMTGLNCGTVSALAWPLLKGGVDIATSIADIDGHRAVEDLHSMGLNAGPCGAAPLAALRQLASQNNNILTPESVVVLLATEGPREYPVPHDSTTADPVVLTQVLTRINSSNPDLSRDTGAGEAAIADYLLAWLAHHDFEVHRLEARPGRPTVVGVARGSGGGRSLMFNGHIDTVTLAGYDGDALSGELVNGAVYGRGAFDMKAGVAASLIAALRARQSACLRGDIILALVADEENLSHGTQELLAAGWHADGAIVSEPTGHEMMLSHKGFVWAEVDIIGKAGHGSRPDLCIDAITKAGHFLVALEKHGEDLMCRCLAEAVNHPQLGTGTIHAGLIKGGEEVSSYPALCTVSIERRTVPGETPDLVESQLRALLDGLAGTVQDFKYILRMGEHRAPFTIDPEHPFVTLFRKHAEETLQETVNIQGGTYWTDSALLAEKGIQAMLFGVQGGGAHAATEWANVDSIEKAFMAAPAFTVQLVGSPTESQVRQAARIFADLTPGDPLTIALTGGNTNLLQDLAESMIRPIAFQIGDMYTATDENGDMVGFTMWIPPGKQLLSTEDQMRLGYTDFMSKLPDEVKSYSATTLGHDFPKVIDGFTGIENTELNCYWCDFNFVKAEFQRKGVAKSMFQLASKKAQQNGYSMALATTNIRNVAIYERLGFEMKGFQEMPSPWGAWPAWVFLCKPESA